MRELSFVLFLLVLESGHSQELISNPSTFNTGAQGDLYIDGDGIYYIGLEDGTIKGIGNITAFGDNDGDLLSWNDTTQQWESNSPAAFDGWGLNGNNNTSATNFLGTTNDVKMTIRSNNTSMFEIGRRQTLGLYDASSTGIFPYNQPNASVTYIRGTGGNSALQFESSSAAFYKPTLFTDSDGNFVMRGSSAGTDFFEIGSAGASNNGQLLFSIADDGDEPMIFRKYNYTTQSYVEMLRMQGTGLNTDVRVGIDVNGNVPNSTLQVDGSLATEITTTLSNLSLTQDHHTVVLGGNHNIILPAASSCEGRMYVIKNPNNFATSISVYTNLEGISGITTINNNTTIWLQSDGTDWQQISKSEKNYEKIMIWAEESGNLSNNNLQWSFGNGDTGLIGIPLPEEWEAYAVSFNADNSTAGASVQMAVINTVNNTNLFTFTATGATNNMVYTEILTTPVSIPTGTSIGFRTVNENGNISSARVAVWLRRLP